MNEISERDVSCWVLEFNLADETFFLADSLEKLSRLVSELGEVNRRRRRKKTRSVWLIIGDDI